MTRVMADLSGKPAEALPDLTARKYLEIDVDNFGKRLKACKMRVAFQVPKDGKSGAEQLVAKLLTIQRLLKTLASTPKPGVSVSWCYATKNSTTFVFA